MWGPILAAGISAGGSLLGGLMGSSGAQATNASQLSFAMQQQQEAERFNAEQSQINRDWQERMSGTAYQRAMSDMRSAGLNPILAANLGGASTPGGGSASISGVSPGSLSNPGSAMASGVSSASQAGQVYAATKVALQQADKDEAQTKLNEAGTELTKEQQTKTKQETATAKSAEVLNTSTAANKLVEAELMRANANSANAVARVNNRIAEDTEQYGDSPTSKAVGGIIRMLNTISRAQPQQQPSSAKGVAPAYTAPFTGLHDEPYRRRKY